MQSPSEYLRPEIISAVGNFELVAKFVVEGFITGLHKSPYHGFSVEFAQHRPYLPGDPIRSIDWKLFGRTDRHYIKQFEEETNLKAHIILDASRSMGYTSDAKHLTKFRYASILTAALSYMLVRQQDAVGLSIYDEDVRLFMPARLKTSYLREILKVLQTTEPSSETRTRSSLRLALEQIKRRGLVIVVSDFFDDADEIITSLKLLRNAGHEVIAFHVLDPVERTLALGASDATLIDMETNESIKTQPYQLQESYAKAMKDHCEKLKNSLANERIDYLLLDTTEPFDKALTEYLYKRQMMG